MKKISLEITEKQYAAYEKAAEELLKIGIPVTPKNIMQMMIASRNQEEIADDFLKTMKTLITQGKKKLPSTSEKGGLLQ